MLDALSLQVACPKCQVPFVPARSNQTYCSKACQKNAARAPRTVATSAEERRRQELRFGRLRGLSDSFFETHPRYRSAFMIDLIEEARNNAELRGWLTRREQLRRWDHHSGTGRLHIAHCLDHFCSETFGMRSFQVLSREFELPAEEQTVFAALYFGPTGLSIYEDGSLHRRPFPVQPKRSQSRPNSGVLKPSKYDWRMIAKAANDHGWRLYVMTMTGGDDTPAFSLLPQEA